MDPPIKLKLFSLFCEPLTVLINKSIANRRVTYNFFKVGWLTVHITLTKVTVQLDSSN